MRRLLAKTLFVLATANLALAGCQAKSSDSRKNEVASGLDEKATASDESPAPLQEMDGEYAMKKPADRARATGTTSGSGGAVAASPSIVGKADKGAAEANTEGYKDNGQNGWIDTANDNLSTFAADVDTASYTIARRKLNEGTLPPTAAVRVEEFVNYFKYAYPVPDAGSRPFSVHVDVAPSPFNVKREVVRIGVATKAKSVAERKKANLVFLVDTSGSMQSPDKLDLAKQSLRLLVDNLKDGDTVSLVTYAGDTRVVLEPTGLEHKAEIQAAIEDLSSGGSTAMAGGIDLAYQQAEKMLGGDSVTRVIVLSDGDANVGPTSHEEILKTIEDKVREGVMLSTIGFGMGNYKDDMMEQLADKGNGNAFYIDGPSAAKRVFQEQLGSTLEVVAKDVKLQVEFDKRVVARYRLVGYENRDIADDDFRKDEVDAGEVGAGHQVTALYEIERKATPTADVTPHDLVTVRVRAKEPKGTVATESTFAFDPAYLAPAFVAASDDFRFAFAVASFADVLRGAEDAEHWDLKAIRDIAAGAAGQDADRLELVGLIDKAIALEGGPKTARAH